MRQVDALLNGMSEEDLAAYTTNPETEAHIVIGLDRYITVPEQLKRIAVQGDHNVETVIFDCPRYWDGRDLSELKLFINFRCANGALGTYIVDTITIDDTDENIMHFSWLIGGEVTVAKGTLTFLVCAKITDEEGEMLVHWNSELNSEMYVSEGLEAHDTLLEQNPDILTRVLLLTDLTLTRAGVYVGSGDMPDWANVQIDPSGYEDHNVAIGQGASCTDGADNSIAIGYGVNVNKSNQVRIGNDAVEEVIFGNKKINFNADGTVTWTTIL